MPLATHHRELPVSEPHDPAGAVGGAAAARHVPGHDAPGPPREPPQLAPHQLPDAETLVVLTTGTEEVIQYGNYSIIIVNV